MAKRRSKEEMRKNIIQVAFKLLDQKSYNQITMDEIAYHANISKRTLYKYFSSKSELFLEEFKNYFINFADALIANDDPANNPGERLRGMLYNLYDYTKNRPGYFKLLLMYREGFFDNDLSSDKITELHEFMRNTTNQNSDFLVNYWQKSLNTGLYSNESFLYLYHMIIALNKAIFFEFHYNRDSYIGSVPEPIEMLKTFGDMLYLCANNEMSIDSSNKKPLS